MTFFDIPRGPVHELLRNDDLELAKTAKSPIMKDMEPVSKQELGTQIRRLRNAAGLTGEDLGKAIDLSPTAISRIESGIRSLKSTELARIADALDISVLAILNPSSLAGRLQVAARSDGGPSEPSRNDRVVERLRGFAELSSILPPADHQSNLELPTAENGGWQRVTSDRATWAREQLSMDPATRYSFGDLASKIENRFGVDVVVENYPHSLVGAAMSDPECPIIFVNAEQPLQRARFTLAHEFYHFLVGDGQSVVFDKDLSGPSSERDANAFAAAFLMPKEGIEAVIDEHGRHAYSIGQMILRFEVSYQALAYRLHNAKFVDAEGRDTLVALRFTGLLDAIAEDDSLAQEDSLLHRLQELRTSSPGRRTPTHLAARALDAFTKGMISIQPLANLISEDAEDLLEQLQRTRTSTAAFEDDFGQDVKVSDSEMAEYFSTLAGIDL